MKRPYYVYMFCLTDMCPVGEGSTFLNKVHDKSRTVTSTEFNRNLYNLAAVWLVLSQKLSH